MMAAGLVFCYLCAVIMDELRMKSCSRILLLVATAAVAVSCQCAQKSAAQTEWIERPDAPDERGVSVVRMGGSPQYAHPQRRPEGWNNVSKRL